MSKTLESWGRGGLEVFWKVPQMPKRNKNSIFTKKVLRSLHGGKKSMYKHRKRNLMLIAGSQSPFHGTTGHLRKMKMVKLLMNVTF